MNKIKSKGGKPPKPTKAELRRILDTIESVLVAQSRAEDSVRESVNKMFEETEQQRHNREVIDAIIHNPEYDKSYDPLPVGAGLFFAKAGLKPLLSQKNARPESALNRIGKTKLNPTQMAKAVALFNEKRAANKRKSKWWAAAQVGPKFGISPDTVLAYSEKSFRE